MKLTLRVFQIVLLILGAIAAAVTLFWFWLAIGVHLAGVTKVAALFCLAAAGFASAAFLVGGRYIALICVTALGIVIGNIWWAFVPATNDRIWAPELAHGGTAVIEGGTVTLSNVRNFVWTTPEEATPSWETRVVNLDQITSVDLFTSVWSNPLIAHVMVSFGFADGQHVVFSNEIRRTEDQVFSTLGGFVREFELIQIVADERDVIHLRTDIRGERVSLFPLVLSPEARKTLFLGFVEFGNTLDAEPAWYNTLTANCTTVPFRIVRSLGDRVPLDWRVLASGMLPGYLLDQGLLPPGLSLIEIEQRAVLPKFGPLPADGVTYSRDIRAAWAN